ncbi:MAG: CPBP family glutamic-type intramembrane protease [Thermoguttaceae bacterium]|nr:CPBP family glutamic-type intramembrane protease [Thermoguttaceae bacterium]MDW8078451.1 CPBP family glutamic-type intramembrane protease [Thermoguttaceae bacterium]
MTRLPGGELLGTAVIALLLGASLLIWVTILARWIGRLPVLPYQPRLIARWTGKEVLAVFLLFHWSFLFNFVFQILEIVTPEDPASSVTATSAEEEPVPESNGQKDIQEKDILHPVIILLQSDPSPSTLLICSFLVVVLAPVAEEFVFRMVLLGYALQKEKYWRISRTKPLNLPRGGLSVLIVSLWFAFLHGRVSGEGPPHQKAIWGGLILTGALALVTIVLVFSIAASKGGSFWQNLGVLPQKLLSDLWLGTLGFLAVSPPLWVVQAQLVPIFAKWGIAPDPIPIFLLALALGTLTATTGRIVPAIMLHVWHNFSSLLIALLSDM